MKWSKYRGVETPPAREAFAIGDVAGLLPTSAIDGVLHGATLERPSGAHFRSASEARIPTYSWRGALSGPKGDRVGRRSLARYSVPQCLGGRVEGLSSKTPQPGLGLGLGLQSRARVRPLWRDFNVVLSPKEI